ncbi:JAB domain-containing protein [Chryseobacterium sp. WG14]|uniref:JAB domain-containing protein n=1 Tax=Chryseobacterium sp. WG14 TaxID=2926909 RepID=UPI00211DC6D9|nr:JAB domain-containing protein [Chryseobacterium sp. WG14]MCQ9641201.1 JAB domain-containing protein [Chryseobacterium sp. WG14]
MNKLMEISVTYNTGNHKKIRINSHKEAYKLVIENWNLGTIEFQEECKVIMMNKGNFVLGIYNVSKGGIDSSVVDIRIILAVALKCNATQLILVHNHPSGNLKPSGSDQTITKNLKNACELLNISLLDHLIITRNSYYSFNEENRF